MDRPIAYDKLAREDRFVRMRAREVAQVKVEQGLPPFPGLLSQESIKERVHGIMVGELQAMEGAGRTVYDFPDAPWEFTMDMARQVWDESRHVDIYIRLLEHLDGYIGEFPETTILWRCACAEDAAARVAGVNRGLEGLACDVFNQLVHIARKMGDPILERAVDFVLADEITHVRMGSKWLTKLTCLQGGMPDRFRTAIAVLAILSMSLGNVVALAQRDIKRLLAYSGIAHMGYVTIALAIFGRDALAAVIVYFFAYVVSNAGAFAAVAALYRDETKPHPVGLLAGAGHRSPFAAAVLALCMFSLAGIPATAGFIGKFFVFKSAIEGGFTRSRSSVSSTASFPSATT